MVNIQEFRNNPMAIIIATKEGKLKVYGDELEEIHSINLSSKVGTNLIDFSLKPNSINFVFILKGSNEIKIKYAKINDFCHSTCNGDCNGIWGYLIEMYQFELNRCASCPSGKSPMLFGNCQIDCSSVKGKYENASLTSCTDDCPICCSDCAFDPPQTPSTRTNPETLKCTGTLHDDFTFEEGDCVLKTSWNLSLTLSANKE